MISRLSIGTENVIQLLNILMLLRFFQNASILFDLTSKTHCFALKSTTLLGSCSAALSFAETLQAFICRDFNSGSIGRNKQNEEHWAIEKRSTLQTDRIARVFLLKKRVYVQKCVQIGLF